jgi:type I restriction enzyme, R subunit
MPIDHREIAFEAAIEAALTSSTGRWNKGAPADYVAELGLDAKQLMAFVQESQPDAWVKLTGILGDDADKARDRLLRRIAGQIDERGTVDVLHRGVREHGVQIDLAYFMPAHGLTPELLEEYAKNRLTVTRQLRYSAKTADELDLVLFVNGIPVASAELKNPLTKQNVEDAKRQYRIDRDPKELFFARRAIVHFAVDPDLVFLTTRLNGRATEFLPFNRGQDGRAGNPDNPGGYPTQYLWEDVWQADAWLDILGRFVHRQARELPGDGRSRTAFSWIFPRYHQWDAVLKLEEDASRSGAGKNYLIQHSAGSGKSNTIAWTAHRLATLHNAEDEKVFDQVIVITDRVVLDRQLQGIVSQFETKKGMVERIEHGSKQLADALTSGTSPIIVSTLQKFPFAQVLQVVVETAATLKDRRYALVVDEAHSSQTGESAAALKALLGGGAVVERAVDDEDDEEPAFDGEDVLAATLAARGQQRNLSFFAFTATPKPKTLEMFGVLGPDGNHHPFHLYSMRQAIEEGFIIDVLQNYTTYKTFWKIAKAAADDPEVVKSEAAAAIARFVALHPTNIAQKVEIIVEHFAGATAPKIGGRAKAMIVTRSRKAAVRYKLAVDSHLADKGYPFKSLVAFSGTVHDDVLSFSEASMNGFPESQTPERFRGDDYRIIIVAEKYQTGFDQPLLHTMYVDKKLEGVRAVQTLSRLNRIHPGKEETFVLDFRNTAEQIEEAFAPFYEGTAAEATDPNELFDAEDKLLDVDVIRWDDVVAMSEVFFKARQQQTKDDHGLLYAALAPARERFKSLDDVEQEDFRIRLKRFVRLYSFMSQVVPYLEARSERLYVYARYLLNYLPKEERGGLDLGEDDLLLTHLRHVKTGDHVIELTATDEPLVSFTGTGDHDRDEEQRARLSQVVEILNERFGTELGPADRLYIEQIGETLAADAELQEQAQANALDNFRFGFDQKFEAAVIDRHGANDELFKKIMDDPGFNAAVRELLLPAVYARLTASQPTSRPARGRQADALRPYVGMWVALGEPDQVLAASVDPRGLVAELKSRGLSARGGILRVPEDPTRTPLITAA